MIHDALAFFLTWTTYGTFLHGDDRGSVDALHNQYGTPRLLPDETLHTIARDSCRFDPVVFDNRMREVVTAVIEEHTALRKWSLHALNVRTNHVHVVVTAHCNRPEVVMDQYKAWGTRRLRAAGLMEPERPVWTSHGSTRYIWDSPGFAEAIAYVRDWQGSERFEGGRDRWKERGERSRTSDDV